MESRNITSFPVPSNASIDSPPASQPSFKLEHTWTISITTPPSVAQRTAGQPHEPINSPPFSHDQYPQQAFMLQFYPTGYASSDAGYVSVFFSTAELRTTRTLVHFNFALIGGDGTKYFPVPRMAETTYLPGMGFSQFLLASKVFDPSNGWYLDGQLKLYFEANVYYRESSTIPCPVAPLSEPPRGDLESLRSSRDSSDWVVHVNGIDGGYIYNLHKAILETRSTFFAARSRETNTAEERMIIHSNIRNDAFLLYLQYLYSGNLPEPEDMTTHLMFLALKFFAIPLKLAIEDHLIAMLSQATLADTLYLADRFGCLYLRTACIDYIAAHPTEVLDANLRPVLRTETLQSVVRRQAEMMTELKKKKRRKRRRY